jgi:hypothetical protein
MLELVEGSSNAECFSGSSFRLTFFENIRFGSNTILPKTDVLLLLKLFG